MSDGQGHRPGTGRVAFTPQIGLLDLGLPVMDGYELAAHLRDVRGLSAIRLVAVGVC